MVFFFFKQKTAYEICSSEWSSEVCSSDLLEGGEEERERERERERDDGETERRMMLPQPAHLMMSSTCSDPSSSTTVSLICST